MSKAEEFSSTYIVNIVFNAFFRYHNPRHKKNFIVTKAFENIAPESGCVSDLSVGLLAHPLYVARLVMGLEQYAKSNTTYNNKIMTFLITANFLSYASFFGLLALTVDRFLAIHLHLRYQEIVTHKRAVTVVISITVLASFLSSFTRWIPVIKDGQRIYTSIEIVL